MLSESLYGILTAKQKVCEESQLCGEAGELYVREGRLLSWVPVIVTTQTLAGWLGAGDLAQTARERAITQVSGEAREAFQSVARVEEMYEKALSKCMKGKPLRLALDANGKTLVRDLYPRIARMRDHPHLRQEEGRSGLEELEDRFKAFYKLCGEKEAGKRDWKIVTRAIKLSQEYKRLVDIEAKIGMEVPFAEIERLLAAVVKGKRVKSKAIREFAQAINEADDLTVSEVHLLLGDLVLRSSLYDKVKKRFQPLLRPYVEHELTVYGCTIFEREDPEYQERIEGRKMVSIGGKEYRLGKKLGKGRYRVKRRPNQMVVLSQKNAAEVGIREVACDIAERKSGVPRLRRLAIHPVGWFAIFEKPADRAVDRGLDPVEQRRGPYDLCLEKSLIKQFSMLVKNERISAPAPGESGWKPMCSLSDAVYVTKEGQLRWSYDPRSRGDLDPASIEAFFLQVGRDDRQKVYEWMRRTGVGHTDAAKGQVDAMLEGHYERGSYLELGHAQLQIVFAKCAVELRNEYKVPLGDRLEAVIRGRAAEALKRAGVIACLPESFARDLQKAVLLRRRYRMKTRILNRRWPQIKRAAKASPKAIKSDHFFHKQGIFHKDQIQETRQRLLGKKEPLPCIPSAQGLLQIECNEPKQITGS